MKRIILPLLALAALLATVVPAPARAQDQPPVSLEIRAGYDDDGSYRVGHWFPVTIVAANDGPDVSGALEWRFPGEEGATFRYELDLPRGARKRITLPVVTSETHGSAALSLVAGGAQLLRQPVRLDPIGASEVTVGVLSSDATLLNSLRAVVQPDGRTTAVTHLDPARLPDSAALLAGLDTLFVHDVATADLSDAQREALALWTRLGGDLIVGGGPGAERTAPGLAELLPVEVGQLRSGIPAGSLAGLAQTGANAGNPPALTASDVTLREGATSLDGAGLLVAREEGAGRVIFAAFDLMALRAWAGEADLWGAIIRAESKMQMGQSFRLRSENILRDSLQIDALQLPSTAVLLLLMLIYIVIIGPVNFLLLRRAGRVELAWVTTPLLVAAFLGSAYGASFALRGTSPQISQLTIVQGFEGADRGQSTAFLGVYSPQRRSYELSFDPAVLVTPATFEGFSFRSTPVTGGDVATTVQDLLIDVSSLRTLIVEQQAEVAPAVASTLRVEQQRAVGEIALTGGPALRNAVVVRGDSAQELGELRPGDGVQIDFSLVQSNFPDLLQVGGDGMFNRERVMYSLFGYDRFTPGGPAFQGERGIPERDGFYLLGWTDGAGVGTTIDGDGSRQQGETLYIIRLDS